jgi:hypothetical protein
VYPLNHILTEPLHQAAALKFGAIVRIIKLNDWPFEAMPSPLDADGVTTELAFDLIMKYYKEE